MSTGDERKPARGRWLKGGGLAVLVVGIVLGILFWGGFNWAMELSNSEAFCISCHEMESTVYAEMKGTIHESNRTGIRATCADCHVPRPWHHKVIRKIRATNELYYHLIGSVDTPEKFEAKRLEMAQRVWDSMIASDSRECRNCHTLAAMNLEKQQKRSRADHEDPQGKTCIECHKGIAHKPVHKELEKPAEEEGGFMLQ